MGKDSAEFVTKLEDPVAPAKKAGFPAFLIAGTVLALGASALVYAQLEWGVLDQVLAKKTVETAEESQATEPEEKPRTAASKKINKAPASTAEEAAAPRRRARASETPASPPVTTAAVRRFPADTDIQKGMSVLSLRQAFGAPDMRTTDSERGKLLERWMYMSRELGAVTVVLMADGKVVSAQTTGSR